MSYFTEATLGQLTVILNYLDDRELSSADLDRLMRWAGDDLITSNLLTADDIIRWLWKKPRKVTR